MEEWQKRVVKAQNEISNQNPDSYYDERYRADENWYWYWIPKWIWSDALKNAGKVRNLLDVGCAFGTLLVFAKGEYGCEITGIDMKRRLSEKLQRKYDITFYELNIEKDVEIGVKYDRILFTEIFEHLLCNPTMTLRKLHSMLNDDGKLFLSTPDGCSWGRLTTFYEHVGQMPMQYPENAYPPDEHIYQYTEGEILRIFDESGFKVEKSQVASPPYWGRHLCHQLVKK